MIKSVEKLYNGIQGEFNSYKLTSNNEEVWSIPLDTANKDYQAIQEWIAAGNSVIDNPPE
jgi:hypothetical protein